MRASQVVAVSFVSAVFANDVAPLSATHAVDEIAALLQPHLHNSGASESKLRKTMHGVHLSTQLAEDEVTPGSTDALNKALDGVIKQIGERVDKKIIQDHKETNAEIGRRVGKLVSKTTDSVNRMEEAKTSDQTWVDCVGVEKEKMVQSEEAIQKVEQEKTEYARIKGVRNKKEKFEWPHFTRPVYQCQLTSDRKCGAELGRFSHTVSDILTVGEQKANQADSDFQAALNNWKDSKKRTGMAIRAANKARDDWQKQSSSCDDMVETRKTAMCWFGLKFQEKCGKLAEYKKLMDDVNQVDGGVYSHPDRQSQWKATHVVKCMLRKVISGTPLNSESMKACAATVDFDQSVGLLDLQAEKVAKATTPDNFSCNEKEIEFSGFTWNIPAMEDASSNGYVKSSGVSYQVTLATDTSPFDFCNTEKESCSEYRCTRGKPKNREHICQGKCTDLECCQ